MTNVGRPSLSSVSTSSSSPMPPTSSMRGSRGSRNSGATSQGGRRNRSHTTPLAGNRAGMRRRHPQVNQSRVLRPPREIGRASCREREGIAGGAGGVQEKKKNRERKG